VGAETADAVTESQRKERLEIVLMRYERTVEAKNLHDFIQLNPQEGSNSICE